MIRTWAADITPLLDENCYRQYYRRAPEFRRKKADRLKSPLKKAQSIGVWDLYEQMKQYYGLDGNEIYNFSHSDKYVLCSVCTAKTAVLLGCDAEMVGKYRTKLAKHLFCESEYAYIEKQQIEKQPETFTRYWVLKESFMKATRKGMAMPLRAFEICLGNPSVLIRQPEEFQSTFYYMESALGEGACRAAVCSTDKEIDPEIKVVQMGYKYG